MYVLTGYTGRLSDFNRCDCVSCLYSALAFRPLLVHLDSRSMCQIFQEVGTNNVFSLNCRRRNRDGEVYSRISKSMLNAVAVEIKFSDSLHRK